MDLYTGISDFKKVFLPRTNVVKNETGDLVTDCKVYWLGGETISVSS